MGTRCPNPTSLPHILIVGWNGPATEIIKNAVLSGVGSITILDPRASMRVLICCRTFSCAIKRWES